MAWKRKVGGYFTTFAQLIAEKMGSAAAFITAFLMIILWAITGPLFNFSDSWQLVINTGTTIITFLMVFLIQNTQNRDTKILNLKLDELIKAIKKADNAILDLTRLSDEELKRLEEKYIEICKTSQKE